jgi:hypothetical protein
VKELAINTKDANSVAGKATPAKEQWWSNSIHPTSDSLSSSPSFYVSNKDSKGDQMSPELKTKRTKGAEKAESRYVASRVQEDRSYIWDS